MITCLLGSTVRLVAPTNRYGPQASLCQSRSAMQSSANEFSSLYASSSSISMTSWMNMAFTLDTLQENAGFVDLEPPVIMPRTASSTSLEMPAMAAVSAFLAEMEELDCENEFEDHGGVPSSPQLKPATPKNEPELKRRRTATTVGSEAIAPRAIVKRKRKKKISSSQRTKRDMLMLRETIAELEQELERAKAGESLVDIGHWKATVEDERRNRKRAEAENLYLQRTINQNQRKLADLAHSIADRSRIQVQSFPSHEAARRCVPGLVHFGRQS